MGQNSKIWGVKKIRQRFGKTEPLDSKPDQTLRVCCTPPKMVPPYNLGTCPPKTLRTLWCTVIPSSRKNWFSEDPWFWPKYSNGPGVAKNWHISKLTKRGPRRCLKLTWDQIWQNKFQWEVSQIADKRFSRAMLLQYSRLHMVIHLWQFVGQNSEIWGGVKKIWQRFGKTEPLDLKLCQTPQGCHTPPENGITI